MRYLCAATVVAAFISVSPVDAAGPGTTQNAPGLSCKAILESGDSSGDGLYWIDPNGGSSSDAFQAYCDMTTDGGGWTLAVNSVIGEEPLTNDMTSNTGVPGFDRGHTRNAAALALYRDAEIRYLLVNAPSGPLFDAKFVGRYHRQLPVFMLWTPLAGHLPGADTLLANQFGRDWSTSLSDRDGFNGSCANLYGGVPWHYGTCWSAMPTDPRDGSTQGPPASGGGIVLSRFSIFVREVDTLQEPAADTAPSFALTANLPTGGGPGRVAIADFDDDGHQDILTTNTTGGLSTFTVRYANGTVLQQSAPPGPHYITTGQFTSGDNRLDFAVANATGQVTVYVNQGGSFVPVSSSGCAATGSAATGIASGDFDSNGMIDLALTCSGGALMIAPGFGNGVFGFLLSLPTNVTPTALAVADLNGDGDLDIVVTGGSSGCFNVFIGSPGISFSPNRQCVTGSLGKVVAGDWNGDGRPDLVSGSGSMLLTLQNLDGVHFSAGSLFGGGVADVALGDVDNDGKLDLIVALNTPDIRIGLGSGSGAFAFDSPSYLTSSAPRWVAVGDLDGDNRPDIVTADTATDSISVFTNTFNGNLAPLAYHGTLTVMEGTTEIGILAAADPEGAPLTFALTSTNGKGTATLTNASTGAYSYTARLGESGTDVLTFTASDGVMTSATGRITVTIAPRRVPEIRWVKPASIVYGTALGAAHLNATADVGGTFTYSPAAGTLLHPGWLQELNLTFTPSDTVHYRPLTVTSYIDVFQAPLTVRTVDASIVFGQPVPAFTANFSGFVNGESPTSLNGALTFSAPASTNAGRYAIVPTGAYSRDYTIDFQPGTLTIQPAPVTVSLTATPSLGAVLQPVKLIAAISVVAPGAGVPTGNVRFFDGATMIGTASVSSGVATLIAGLAPGPHALTAEYAGGGNFAASALSAPAAVTIRPFTESTLTIAYSAGTPTALGQRATLKAGVVTLTGSTVPTGTVVFFDGAAVLGSASLVNTGLTLSTATLSTTALSPGPHFITAVYLGSATLASSVSAPAVHNVYSGTPPVATTLVLGSSGSPSVQGQPVTFIATVSPSNGTPTGTVVFLADNALIGTGTLSLVGGAVRAQVTTSGLSMGVHIVSAIYVGDGVFAAAAATPITQGVQ